MCVRKACVCLTVSATRRAADIEGTIARVPYM